MLCSFILGICLMLSDIFSDTLYWEDLTEQRHHDILCENAISPIVRDYYNNRWTITDNEQTFCLLDALTNPRNGDELMLYFYLLNGIALKADSAVSEVMGFYCLSFLKNAPDYVLSYFGRNEQVKRCYESMIGYELAMTGKENSFQSFAIEIKGLTSLSDSALLSDFLIGVHSWFTESL